jgi:hypothetical protein
MVAMLRGLRGEPASVVEDSSSVPWWIRGYLLLGAAQGLSLGITGLLIPAELQIPLRVTPLNGRFVAALYAAAALGVLLSALVRRREDAQVFVVGFGLATTLIGIVTVLHWSEFMDPALPHRPLWLTAYVLDPILALVIVPAAGLWRFPAGAGPRLLAIPLAVQSAVLGAAGLVLLVLPSVAAAAWPWALTPVLAQIYGSFFLAFSVGGVLAIRMRRPVTTRNLVVALLAMSCLVLTASLLHAERFKPGPVSWLWFGAFAVGAVTFAVGLLRFRRSIQSAATNNGSLDRAGRVPEASSPG